MNYVNFSKVFVCLFLIATTSYAQNSVIYSPFLMSNPEKLEFNSGYCKNASEEKKLWTGINRFAKSFLLIVPSIPPEQKTYIQTELSSTNFKRIEQITRNSFYKMNDLYEEISNVEQISSTYLKHQEQLSLGKKMEIIGRTLANITNENIPYEDISSVAADLRAKGYYVSGEDLRLQYGVKFGIKRALISHLICFGEKLN